MSFFSSAVRLIKRRKADSENLGKSENVAIVTDIELEKNFSLRNYVKDSFSVLIIKPLSGCVMKIIRITSFGITGIISGGIVALLSIGIFLQFGSVENTVISAVILSQFEKFFPDADLSMKSAMLRWNPEVGAFEIDMRRVRLDDLAIPRVTLLPDYAKSFKQHKFITKSVSIINPKINLDVDGKSIYINPNLEKGGHIKELFVPLSNISVMKRALNSDAVIKCVNADVFVTENGAEWNLKNVYCQHVLSEAWPSVFECSAVLPNQKYTSNFSVKREISSKFNNYNVNIGAINPTVIINALSKRNTPIDRRILAAISGYNLPVSGKINLRFDHDKNEFLGGDFNLTASSGSIKLPVRSSLSLNLGKKIDNGSIVGSFTEDHAKIDEINVCYGNSGLQLTGIDVPMSMFKFLDVANINGTLRLSNINVREMEAILPNNISKSVIPTFKSYLPGFTLESFQVGVKGPIVFGERANEEQIEIGAGRFKIKDAKIPLNEHIITDVDATGNITDDGFDIRLSRAKFGKTSVNSGTFFLSNKDGSWIGNVNASVSVDDIPSFVTDISQKLANIPLNKLGIKGTANLDMKLLRVNGDPLANKELPFRIIEGDGVLKSPDNTKSLKFSWGEEGLFLDGYVHAGDYKIALKMEEDFNKDSGEGSATFVANSPFLATILPSVPQVFGGNFKLKVDSHWKGKDQTFDINMDLKDATCLLPVIGDLKAKKDNGIFSAHVRKVDNGYEFSNIKLESGNNTIHGKVAVADNGTLIKALLDTFNIRGYTSKVNILREAEDKIRLSIIGDTFDARNIFSAINQLEPSITVSAYVDLGKIVFSDEHFVKNIKGSVSLKNSKLIGGACYGVIGDNITLALSVKEINNGTDNLVSLSASNAGEFLKFLRIADGVEGGSINIASVSSKNTGASFSGDFEIRDFMIRNNPQFTKLVSLTTTNLLQTTGNVTAGFNTCTGSFFINGDKIQLINGKMAGPTMLVSFNGDYNRMDDDINIIGTSLPISAIINAKNNRALTSKYRLTGPLGTPLLMSEGKPRLQDFETLAAEFADSFPIAQYEDSDDNDYSYEYEIGAPELPKVKDPFSDRAFDKRTAKTTGHATPKKRVSKEFGVRITHGVSSI